MTRPKLIRVERSQMEVLATRFGHEDTPRVYTDRNVLVRELFWRRLGALLSMSRAARRGRALDFGGGNGVLLPTLSRLYGEVVCVDLRAEMAEEIARGEGLGNLRVHSGELSGLGLPDGHFDSIFAADVLEHVVDLEALAGELRRVLAPGGELLVSCPSENHFYEVGRKVFRYVKPADHLHSATEVERMLGRALPLDRRRYFPVNLPWLGVFSLARFVRPG
jgi:SAM-dependent methyltransferase